MIRANYTSPGNHNKKAHDTRMIAIIKSILNGSSSGEFYDALNSSFYIRDLEPARARKLAVINYARLSFEAGQSLENVKSRNPREQVLQTILSARTFRRMHTDTSWVSSSSADDLRDVEAILSTDSFSRHLRMVEPPKRMRLDAPGLQAIRGYLIHEFLHRNELSAAIVSSDSNPQHIFICLSVPVLSQQPIRRASSSQLQRTRPERVFIIFNHLLHPPYTAQWLITASESIWINRVFALFSFWKRSLGSRRSNRNRNSEGAVIYVLGPALAVGNTGPYDRRVDDPEVILDGSRPTPLINNDRNESNRRLDEREEGRARFDELPRLPSWLVMSPGVTGMIGQHNRILDNTADVDQGRLEQQQPSGVLRERPLLPSARPSGGSRAQAEVPNQPYLTQDPFHPLTEGRTGNNSKRRKRKSHGTRGHNDNKNVPTFPYNPPEIRAHPSATRPVIPFCPVFADGNTGAQRPIIHGHFERLQYQIQPLPQGFVPPIHPEQGGWGYGPYITGAYLSVYGQNFGSCFFCG